MIITQSFAKNMGMYAAQSLHSLHIYQYLLFLSGTASVLVLFILSSPMRLPPPTFFPKSKSLSVRITPPPPATERALRERCSTIPNCAPPHPVFPRRFSELINLRQSFRYAMWTDELAGMARRIHTMRSALVSALQVQSLLFRAAIMQKQCHV